MWVWLMSTIACMKYVSYDCMYCIHLLSTCHMGVYSLWYHPHTWPCTCLTPRLAGVSTRNWRWKWDLELVGSSSVESFWVTLLLTSPVLRWAKGRKELSETQPSFRFLALEAKHMTRSMTGGYVWYTTESTWRNSNSSCVSLLQPFDLTGSNGVIFHGALRPPGFYFLLTGSGWWFWKSSNGCM